MQGSLMEEDKKNKKKKTEDELRATWAGRTDIVADVKDGHGYLHSGTIETIVHWLLDHVEYPPPQENKSNDVMRSEEDGGAAQPSTEEDRDEQALQVFIISYRQFVSPTGFFTILEERFTNATSDPKSRYAVLKMLSVWLNKYLERDFFFHDRGNRLFDQLLKFLKVIQERDHSEQANKLKLLILKVKHVRREKNKSRSPGPTTLTVPDISRNGDTSPRAREEGTTSSTATASPMASPGLAPSSRLLRTTSRNVAGDQALVPGLGTQASLQKRFSLCEMPLVELAEQLTLIELGMFRSIREREFLNLNWKRTEHKRNARHIVKMVERFNKVSYWVATRIVRETDLKRRCSLLKRFIILAEKCAELNNFNTLMEVLAGLNLYPIQRLKQTWQNLSEKYKESMERLEQMMENKHNFKNYRDRLAKIKTNGEPTLPYLGVYLRDLTFIEEGNKTYVTEHKLINYEKIQLVGQVIREVQYFQQNSTYEELQKSDVPSTLKYLKKLRGLKQEELDERSRKCEPPKNGTMDE